MRSFFTITAAMLFACAAALRICPACRPPICPLELIAECKCKTAAAQACVKQCGGPAPPVVVCGPIEEVSVATDANAAVKRAAEAAPDAIPEPTSVKFEQAVKLCECEPVFCPEELVAGCQCRNAAESKCYQQNIAKGNTFCPRPNYRFCPHYTAISQPPLPEATTS